MNSRENQAIFCAQIMQRIEAHVLKPETARHYNGDEYIPRGYGCTPSEIEADIRLLRRELLQLARMH